MDYKKRTIGWFFRQQKKNLAVVTVTGILYNVGLGAGPWFEGQMVQYLLDIMGGRRTAVEMIRLALCYLVTILIVQGSRFLKRLYVRKFANETGRSMKELIYHSIVRLSVREAQDAGRGELMTRAIQDADECAEGMRKFTTEVFDTGVALCVYIVMLFVYDWHIAVMALLAPPIAYYIAHRLGGIVAAASREAKKSTGRLNEATMDLISNVLTYRVYGEESVQRGRYETSLTDYEHHQIRSQILEGSLQPLYMAVSMAGALPILYYGSRNVLGTGFRTWDIAALSTVLAVYVKLSKKSSTAAKLFNAVQKARVSWQRIRPYVENIDTPAKLPEGERKVCPPPHILCVSDVSFGYPDGPEILHHISFTAKSGEIIGITGMVASGKSTLGRLLLEEYPHSGSITLDGKPLASNDADHRILYQGHNPELLTMSIADNVAMEESRGDPARTARIDLALQQAHIDGEVRTFADGRDTLTGRHGQRLSGGQQARIALARVLYHKGPVLVLDDPFSAVDMRTEDGIFKTLREQYSDRIILLISHRLSLFPVMDHVLWLENGTARLSTHEELLRTCPVYADLYAKQTARAIDLDEAGGLEKEKVGERTAAADNEKTASDGAASASKEGKRTEGAKADTEKGGRS